VATEEHWRPRQRRRHCRNRRRILLEPKIPEPLPSPLVRDLHGEFGSRGDHHVAAGRARVQNVEGDAGAEHDLVQLAVTGDDHLDALVPVDTIGVTAFPADQAVRARAHMEEAAPVAAERVVARSVEEGVSADAAFDVIVLILTIEKVSAMLVVEPIMSAQPQHDVVVTASFDEVVCATCR